jgi:hypothetical protein
LTKNKQEVILLTKRKAIMGQAKQRRKEIEALKNLGEARRERLDGICNQPLDLTKSIYEIGEQLTGGDIAVLKLMTEYTGNEPRLVKPAKDKEYTEEEINRCYQNATIYAQQVGGKLIKGWQGYSDAYFCKENKMAYGQALAGIVEWNQHAIVEMPTGEWVDPTPQYKRSEETNQLVLDDRKHTTIFWQDDRLLTEDAMSYGINYSSLDMPYAWGPNAIYIPKASDWYIRRPENQDLADVERGVLTHYKGGDNFSAERLEQTFFNQSEVKIKTQYGEFITKIKEEV